MFIAMRMKATTLNSLGESKLSMQVCVVVVSVSSQPSAFQPVSFRNKAEAEWNIQEQG